MDQYISKQQIRRQWWNYYFVLIAWPVYIFFLTAVQSKIGNWSILLMVFPGICLYMWIACLMHESWLNYVETIDNTSFCNLLSYMMLADPQLYRIIHGYHHSKVNTFQDTEFHPLGRIENKYLRYTPTHCQDKKPVLLRWTHRH